VWEGLSHLLGIGAKLTIAGGEGGAAPTQVCAWCACECVCVKLPPQRWGLL